MTLEEINRLRGLKAKDDGIAFDLEVLKVADELLDAAERAERAEKANAVLRAECEAWRAADRVIGLVQVVANATDHIGQYGIVDACAATDAAGALKGVE